MKLYACALIAALCLLVATPARAQSSPTTAQTVNALVSDGTLAANVLMTVLQDFKAPDKSCAFKQSALQVGLAIGISEVLKAVVRRQRPDLSDYRDFPSEHTAIAFASSGWSVYYGYSLAIGTGVERRTSDRHDWTGVIAGAAVGEGSKWLGARLWKCA